MPQPGRLITIEGIDGTGKSTLAAGLHAALSDLRIPVRLLREPGGVETAERIRDLVKDPRLAVAPSTEALLYAAARAQLVEESIRPGLQRGDWILLDRFVDSSLAYQGGGRGLGVEAVRSLNRFATRDLVADRTLLLWLDPQVARARAAVRGEAPDRLEQEGDDFFARITGAYEELAEAEPGRIRRLDASRPAPVVLDQALDALSDLLAHPIK